MTDLNADHSDERATGSRPSGRPRGPSSATQYAVLSAAWRILTDEGITALTPTRLHTETGVARTTIYRHWPDASSVVADIVAGASQRRVAAELSGDLRADLLAALETLTFRLRHRPVGPLLSALLAGEAQAEADSPTSADYLGALIAPIREVIDTAIEAATLWPGDHERGAHATDALLHDMVGPMLIDVLLLGGDPFRINDTVVVDRFLARYQARARPATPPLLQPEIDGIESPAQPADGVSG
ncbi:MAG: TetR/AcrR family transcriptional regulator [Actinomycetota bacterium]